MERNEIFIYHLPRLEIARWPKIVTVLIDTFQLVRAKNFQTQQCIYFYYDEKWNISKFRS